MSRWNGLENSSEENKMAEEQVDVEYISLHGYTRNTSSDTNVCGTPAERGQECLTSGKEYIDPHETWYNEGTRAKNKSVSSIGPALSGWGN